MFFIWLIETTTNVPSPVYWLEMVTTSEDNSVCEGKMTITASFLLTDFFNMVHRTDSCAFSNPWSSLFRVTFSALAFVITSWDNFFFLLLRLFFFSLSTFSSLFWFNHLKGKFLFERKRKNNRTRKNQTHVLFYVVELWHWWVTYLFTRERTFLNKESQN